MQSKHILKISLIVCMTYFVFWVLRKLILLHHIPLSCIRIACHSNKMSFWCATTTSAVFSLMMDLVLGQFFIHLQESWHKRSFFPANLHWVIKDKGHGQGLLMSCSGLLKTKLSGNCLKRKIKEKIRKILRKM